MRSGTLAFIAGILCLQQLTGLPSINWAFGLFLFVPVFLFTRKRVSRLASAVIIGFLWALWHAHLVLSQGLPKELEGKDVQVEGQIATIPTQRGRKWRFEFEIRRLVYQGRVWPVPKRVVLSWYEASESLMAGDAWRFTIRLKRPAGFMNPGGLDYERWLFSQRVNATGYVRGGTPPIRLLTTAWQDYPLQRLRQTVLFSLNQQLADHPVRGIVTALAVGHRAAISPQQWQIFRQTGTSHLVAISGLHVGLIAGLVFFLVSWCWRHLGRLPLYFAAPRAAAVAAILVAAVYAALAGWSLPTQRALIMVSVAMLALIFQRAVAPGRTLALALLLVLCYDPLAVLAPGLWLSFGAVAVILFVITGHSFRHSLHQRLWAKWGRAQWFVSLGLFPLLITFFQQASLISPLANLFAVPLVSMLVVPLVLLGVAITVLLPQVGTFLLKLAADLLLLMVEGLDWLAGLPLSQWIAPTPDMFVLCLAVTGTILLLLPRAWPLRWFGLILLVPLVFNRPTLPAQGEFNFTLLDVGQGLSAVVQTRHHALVYDTGPRYSQYFDTGSAVVIPFLWQQGIHQVDKLIVSHGDNDHIGGVQSVLAQVPVQQILTSDAKLLNNPLSKPCLRGQAWQWDGVLFQILSPPVLNNHSQENNQSCVLHISSPMGAVLLPGDIEVGAERALLQQYSPRDLNADILVAPHHGSKTSSSQAFLAAVRPKFVLFPIGYRNRYRFPNQAVVVRYETFAPEFFDSASHGAISFTAGSDGLLQSPVTWRQQQQRYWHTSMDPRIDPGHRF